MSPDIPSSDPVSDFLQREQKAIEAIERNAHSFSNTRKRDNESKIPKPSKQEKEIDWEQVYEHMKNINYEEEAMNCGEDFLFLKERYEGKQLDPSVFNKMKAAHEECVREERQENDILVKKAKERSNEILSKIEEEEKLECEEQFHKYTQYHYCLSTTNNSLEP